MTIRMPRGGVNDDGYGFGVAGGLSCSVGSAVDGWMRWVAAVGFASTAFADLFSSPAQLPPIRVLGFNHRDGVAMPARVLLDSGGVSPKTTMGVMLWHR